jgi:hypothetical protein
MDSRNTDCGRHSSWQRASWAWVIHRYSSLNGRRCPDRKCWNTSQRWRYLKSDKLNHFLRLCFETWTLLFSSPGFGFDSK